MERSAAAANLEQRPPAAYIAEFIGTFVLVFSVTLAVSLFVNSQGTGSDWAVVGLVHFLVLFMLVMTIGSISGAHLNPAVTLALLALRKIRPNDAAVYILLQLAGAVAGALMTKFLLIDDLADQQNVGATAVNLSLLGSNFAGVIAEGLGTFFLVWADRRRCSEPARDARLGRPRDRRHAGLRGDDHRSADRCGAEPGPLVRPRAGGRRVGRRLGLHHRPDRRRCARRHWSTGTCSSRVRASAPRLPRRGPRACARTSSRLNRAQDTCFEEGPASVRVLPIRGARRNRPSRLNCP